MVWGLDWSFERRKYVWQCLHWEILCPCRCKQPVGIVVEMDRILRPGGWAIIRDKVEILDPLEVILRSLHWEIHMTYAKDKEGIICAQKTTWRPWSYSEVARLQINSYGIPVRVLGKFQSFRVQIFIPWSAIPLLLTYRKPSCHASSLLQLQF